MDIHISFARIFTYVSFMYIYIYLCVYGVPVCVWGTCVCMMGCQHVHECVDAYIIYIYNHLYI